MNTILPINDEDFVMTVAKAISRERLIHDTEMIVKSATGISIKDDPGLLEQLDHEFDHLWSGMHPNDAEVRDRFRSDAVAAINAINLHLLTSLSE